MWGFKSKLLKLFGKDYYFYNHREPFSIEPESDFNIRTISEASVSPFDTRNNAEARITKETLCLEHIVSGKNSRRETLAGVLQLVHCDHRDIDFNREKAVLKTINKTVEKYKRIFDMRYFANALSEVYRSCALGQNVYVDRHGLYRNRGAFASPYEYLYKDSIYDIYGNINKSSSVYYIERMELHPNYRGLKLLEYMLMELAIKNRGLASLIIIDVSQKSSSWLICGNCGSNEKDLKKWNSTVAQHKYLSTQRLENHLIELGFRSVDGTYPDEKSISCNPVYTIALDQLIYHNAANDYIRRLDGVLGHGHINKNDFNGLLAEYALRNHDNYNERILSKALKRILEERSRKERYEREYGIENA